VLSEPRKVLRPVEPVMESIKENWVTPGTREAITADVK
jgi:hypothetical protein